MSYVVKMRDPADKSKKVHLCSPQNALDLEQHLGWKRLGVVEVEDGYYDNPQDVIDRAGDSKTAKHLRRNSAQATVMQPGDTIPGEDDDDLDDFDDDDEDPDAEGDGDEDVDPDDEGSDDDESAAEDDDDAGLKDGE